MCASSTRSERTGKGGLDIFIEGTTCATPALNNEKAAIIKKHLIKQGLPDGCIKKNDYTKTEKYSIIKRIFSQFIKHCRLNGYNFFGSNC